MSAVDMYLASTSPRRRELLQQIGVRFDTLKVDMDETPMADETPQAYVLRLALAKARAGHAQLGGRKKLPVLGGDTAVVCDEHILGKPRNEQEALDMLDMLSGRTHEVLSGISLVQGEREVSRVVTTHVTFHPLSKSLCQRYWQTGEPADKAGGYGIQGFAGIFVAHINGSYTNVVGLPVAETAELLNEMGVTFWNGR